MENQDEERRRPERDEGRRAGGPLHLAAAIESFVRDHRLRGRDRTADVAELLREAAGPLIGPHLRPLRLRGGELAVQVDSASLLQELVAFSGRAVEKRLAELCRSRGLQPVQRLVFRHAN
ncbi:MAG: DciA family protein [Planctomycetota bacterium]